MRKYKSINQTTPSFKTLKRAYATASGNLSYPKLRRLVTRCFWLFSAVILGFLFLSPELFAPASADNMLVGFSSTGNNTYVSVSNDDEALTTIVPSSEGSLGAVQSDVLVSTNVSTGYSLYLNMSASSGTNTLYNSSDTSNYISPASGTISTPATLSNNQWGFAVLSSTSDLAPGVGTFSSSYATPIPDSSTLWAYVPTMNDATYSGKIKQTSTADTTGAYYSYLTATAGTGASVTNDGGQASGSICPKKWRLPTGNASTGEFTALYSAYGSNKTNLDAAWSPVYVGHYGGSTLYHSGTYAYWWSSTSVSSANARFLAENTSGDIDPAASSYRRHGFSVRCVLGF